MAQGIKALRKVQLGGESVIGTAVAPTVIWRGTGGMPKSDLTIQTPEEDVGIYGGTNRHFVSKIQGSFILDEVPATFEQLPLLLEAGIKAATPAADGPGDGFIRIYPMPTTAQQVIKTFSVEAGDNIAVEKTPYAFLQTITLSGSIGEAWMMGAEGIGKQWAPVSNFVALTLDPVEEILFTKTKFFIGDPDDVLDPGGEIAGMLMSAKIDINTGWVPVFTASGTLTFSSHKCTAPEISVEVTFEHNANSKAEKVLFESNADRKIKLVVTGSDFAVAGTLYDAKTLEVELAGHWESWESLGEQDGNDVVTATFRARYDTLAAMFASFTVVNDITDLFA